MKNQNKMVDSEELKNTHLWGFGGSDAKIFAKVGENGLSQLTKTNLLRIKEVAEHVRLTPDYKSAAMERGHQFEDWFAENFGADYERERKLERDMAINFKTFAHADFYCDGRVLELKCLKRQNVAIQTYYWQLQWYYLLGASEVYIGVCDSNYVLFDDGYQGARFVARDEQAIATLENGIRLIDDNFNNF